MLDGHIFPDLDASFLQKVLGEVIGISLAIDDFLDTCVDEDLGTHRTGICGGIYRGTIDTDTKISCLGHCILFRMDTPAELVSRTGRNIELHTNASQFFTMFRPLGRSVITCRKDPLFLDDDGSDLPPETGGT